MQPERADMSKDLGALSGSQATPGAAEEASPRIGFDPARVAAQLSAAQKRALLAFTRTGFPGDYATAKELGVAGNTLRSLYGFGGVDEETYLLGPILVTDDWWGPTRHWHITEEGWAVRAAIATEAHRAETVQHGSVHEGAGRNGIAQGPSQ